MSRCLKYVIYAICLSLKEIATSKSDDVIRIDDKAAMKLGIAHIPELLLDNTDRNRTSPFAFTGNRFEFRAVGSSDNCAGAMIALNTAVAMQLTEFHEVVEKRIADGETKEKAIFEVLKTYIEESAPVHFDGNGYCDDWKAEAARRGLDCETSVPLIFDRMLSARTVEMFKTTGVLSEKELHARAEVKWETYTKKIQIEARVLGDMAINHILPVASRYQGMLLDKVFKLRQMLPGDKAEKDAALDMELIEKISMHQVEIQTLVQRMVEARKVANKIENEREKAIAYHDTVASLFDEIRYHIDKLELIVDNEMWPLPKYRELLFIR